MYIFPFYHFITGNLQLPVCTSFDSTYIPDKLIKFHEFNTTVKQENSVDFH